MWALGVFLGGLGRFRRSVEASGRGVEDSTCRESASREPWMRYSDVVNTKREAFVVRVVELKIISME